MKTTNATFLSKQLESTIKDDYRVELLEQFEGAITDRDSATQIKVSGDATSDYASGDTFVIPLDDFETEHTITSTPTYAGGKTTIVCSASSFGTNVVGLDIARKMNVTDDILKNGISNIRIHSEGETLNSYLANDVTLSLDNEGGTYYASDGTGLLNSGNVFWVKIIFKLKNNSTEFLYFGGTVYLQGGIQPISANESVKILCVGHLKELERHPGWNIAEELGNPPNITGVELIQVVEPSAGAYEGIRTLNYKYPDGVDIKGLTINSISDDTPLGFRIIKYQPPDLWQYDYGAWSQEIEGDKGVTLTSDKGHTIDVDLPGNFDLMAREDVILVKNLVAPEVDKIGRMLLQFDNGIKQQIKFDFERVIHYDNTTTNYTDITRKICAYDINPIIDFNEADDAIYFMSPCPFLGIDFELITNLIGTLAFAYSRGYEDWGTLSPTDGTSNFSQDGAITWSLPTDWRPTTIDLGANSYNEYYCLRITLSAYTSGTVLIKRALRYFRLRGNDGTLLDVKIKLEKLPEDIKKDDIILKENSSDLMQPCVWLQNLSYQNYLETILDDIEYTSSYRTLDDLKLTSASAIVSLYGQPPKSFFDKMPTALCVDTSTSPETIYLGIEDELWKVTETGTFTYIDKLDLHYKPSGAGSGADTWSRLSIVRLVIDDNGYLQGLAIGSYEIYYAENPECYRLPSIVFRSTNKTAITEQNQIDVSDLSVINPNICCFRMGHYHDTDRNRIGYFSTGPIECGENICVPFKQLCWYAKAYNNGSGNCAIHDIGALTSGDIPSGPLVSPEDQELFYLQAGYYFSDDKFGGDGDAGNLGFRWSLGQKGFILWDEDNDRWIFHRWDGTNYQVAAVDYANTITNLLDTTNYQNQILCGCYYNTRIWFSRMVWDETGGTFPGDLSDCTLERVDNDGSNNITLFAFASDSVEANQSLSSGDEIYCTILDLIYNENDDTIHGCLINRSDFEYHCFVYDVTNDKLYTTQTGTGFTFQNNRQIKEFIYNSNDQKVYAVIVDKRYNEETAFLISAEFTSPVGTPDGTEITLTFESNIKENETDIVQLAMGGSGRIYGLTGNIDYYMFQYDDNFYPRFFLGNTKDDSYRTIVTELAEALNMMVSINPDRKIYFTDRETNKGSMTIEQSQHYLRDTMSAIGNWGHKYDGVEVKWKNPFTGESGVERAGDFGWNRRILTIDNYFIQYPQLAKLIADLYNTFFSQWRKKHDFKTIPLWQLDNRDKYIFNHNGEFDFTTSLEWMIEALDYDFWTGEMAVQGLEIK